MIRLLPVVVLTIFLTGCFGSFPVRTIIEIVEVPRPILYCPAPNWEEIQRPDWLAIHDITPETSDGEVAKRYKATIKQLQDYTKRLEITLERYDATNAAYDELRKQFLDQKKQDGFESTER